MSQINRISQIFQPMNLTTKNQLLRQNVASKSFQLMINMGVITSTVSGMYTFLPFGLRALQKLINFVDEKMSSIGGQKILLPTLAPVNLWQKTSRLDEAKSELFILKDRHGKQFLLNPTFEESVTDLISHVGPLKRDQLPLKLYQISSKFRDEMKPRLGLVRSKEFIMKDMYTFDVDNQKASDSYEIVNEIYKNIFNEIGVPYIKIQADSGLMGGSISHEYHYISDIGEDTIFLCSNCNFYEDNIVPKITNNETNNRCPMCNKTLQQMHSVEVGHTFLLDTKYSKPLEATFIHSDNKKKFLYMGCYGLGLSRILATSLEILSTESEIRWPLKLAPYTVCIIPPKKGSKEEQASNLAYDLYFNLQKSNIDTIIDDRIQMTIGKRLIEARQCGYPIAAIIGKNSLLTSQIEIHDLYNDNQVNLECENIVNYINQLIENHPLIKTKTKICM